MTELLTEGPADAGCHIVLAHGAGAPMTSLFMEKIACLLVERDLRVTRFEFAYMAARRTGERKPPPRAEKLVDEYSAVAADVRAISAEDQQLVIGGKSMGGRVASLAAGDLFAKGEIAGLVCVGYPFHPPTNPQQLRTAHLIEFTCPTLMVQGERDPFGTREEIQDYRLSKAIAFRWLVDGDHDLRPRKTSGASHEGNLEAAADAIAKFCESLSNAKRDDAAHGRRVPRRRT